LEEKNYRRLYTLVTALRGRGSGLRIKVMGPVVEILKIDDGSSQWGKKGDGGRRSNFQTEGWMMANKRKTKAFAL